MDKDYRELARLLFAAATAMTENAHEAATAGQSGALSAEDYVAAAQRLRGGGAGIAALAEAAAVIANPSDGDSSGRADQLP